MEGVDFSCSASGTPLDSRSTAAASSGERPRKPNEESAGGPVGAAAGEGRISDQMRCSESWEGACRTAERITREAYCKAEGEREGNRRRRFVHVLRALATGAVDLSCDRDVSSFQGRGR
jgi:hypothetical protein